MVIDIKLNSQEDRPVFKAILNGKPIDVIFDTGVQCVTFTGVSKSFELYNLKETNKECKLSGFGGNGLDCPIYTGTISIVQSGRLLKFDNVEIVRHELNWLNKFQLVLPVTMFQLFDIRLYSESENRFLEINTHRDDKISYKTKHKENGAISEVLCQTSFSAMNSLLH